MVAGFTDLAALRRIGRVGLDVPALWGQAPRPPRLALAAYLADLSRILPVAGGRDAASLTGATPEHVAIARHAQAARAIAAGAAIWRDPTRAAGETNDAALEDALRSLQTRYGTADLRTILKAAVASGAEALAATATASFGHDT